VLRLGILWLAGADLRLTFLAVPPVLPLIHRDLHLSEKAIGLLSGLPVLMLGLAAIPGSLMIARLGARRATIAALVFVAAVAAARGVGPSRPMLFSMTVLMGAGVAVIQPALPTLVAEWFAAMPAFATAIYANGLLVGEAVPAAAMIPLVLPLVGGDWAVGLALWSAPLAATALLIAVATPAAARPDRRAPVRWQPDWRSKLTWQLGLLMGGTGGLYFSVNAFIPDYLHAIGRPDLVSACLGALNSGQLPASFLALFAIRRLTATRLPFIVTPLLGVVGLGALLAKVGWLIVLGVGVTGLFISFGLILTLALPPQLAATEDVHRLSAGMFAIGYTMSCIVPLIGGVIWDATGVPITAFAAGVASALTVAATGLTLHPRLDRAHA